MEINPHWAVWRDLGLFAPEGALSNNGGRPA